MENLNQDNHKRIENISADKALEKLILGNKNFQEGKLSHPHQEIKDCERLTKSQHPFVAILTCADSRVRTDEIFDQGLGDIFEIRNAGNVTDDHVIGSIEYAVLHLGVNLVLVMAHENCGAVTATVNNIDEGNFIDSLTSSIKPAINQCNEFSNIDEKIEAVSKTHAKLEIQEIISKSKALSLLQNKGEIKILPAYYSLQTRKFEIL